VKALDEMRLRQMRLRQMRVHAASSFIDSLSKVRMDTSMDVLDAGTCDHP
jgi:hypothetical protein